MSNFSQKMARWTADLIIRWQQPITGVELMNGILHKIGSYETEKVERLLNIRKRARRAGVNNLPESDSEEMDPNIQAIHNYFSKITDRFMGRVRDTISLRLQTWNLDSADLQQNDPKHLEALGNMAITETTEFIQVKKFQLQEMRKKELSHKRELNYFKADNELYRMANYPESLILHYGVLCLLVLLESVLNGQFFAKGSDFGLLGGTLMAVMISLVNIVPAVAIGAYPLRWTFSIKWSWKIAGLLMMAGYFSVVVFLNLVVGHYRALLESDPDLAVLEASRLAWSDGLNFGNFHALILFFLGIVFSLAALIKSFIADDRYPGFGKIQRKHEEILHAYQGEVVEIGKLVLKTLKSAMEKIDHRVGSFESVLSKTMKELSATRYVLENSNTIIDQINNNDMELRSLYRDENLRVRTSPPPLCLNDEESLPNIEFESANEEFQKFQMNLDEIAGIFTKFKFLGEQVKSNINEYYEKQVGEVNALIRQLEKEADREFRQEIKEEDQTRALLLPQPIAPNPS